MDKEWRTEDLLKYLGKLREGGTNSRLLHVYVSSLSSQSVLDTKRCPKSACDTRMTVQVELTSETDLFFHYVDECDEKEFERRRDEQRLTLPFSQYAEVLSQLLDCCAADPQNHVAIVVKESNDDARLDFVKVELLRHRVRVLVDC